MTGVPLILFASLAGLLIGSFLNVCVFRMPRDLSVVAPRSFCPGCEKQIAWYDNIPLLSFALLKGRCRHCHEQIPWRYPLVELVTMIFFGLCAAAFGWTPALAKWAIYSAILIELTASDLECRILPDEFTLGGTVVGLICAFFVEMPSAFVSLMLPMSYTARWRWVGESVFASVFSGGAIWLIAFLYEKLRHREGMGLGDVKMIAMIGAFVGIELSLVTLMLASLIGAISGFVYLKVTNQDTATYELPFGTFLGATALGVMAATQIWPKLMGH